MPGTKNLYNYSNTEYNPEKSIGDIHIFTITKIRFNSEKQPDYQYFFKNGLFDQKKKEELKEIHVNMLNMVFYCLRKKNPKFEEVVMAIPVECGLGNRYPGGVIGFITEIWIPALLKVIFENKKSVSSLKTISFMGLKGLSSHLKEIFKIIVEDNGFSYRSYGYIPDILMKEPP